MSNTLDFNKIKKKYLTVTLADEQKTTIMVGTPTKTIMNELTSLEEFFNGLTDDVSPEVLDDLYSTCATVMSRNKTNTKIEKEHLENVFDFEDLMIFFTAYMAFLDALVSEKN